MLVSQQDVEIGEGRYCLTAGNLRAANPHRALVSRRFLRDAPAHSIARNRQPPFCQSSRNGEAHPAAEHLARP
jgi:hypothetical protein